MRSSRLIVLLIIASLISWRPSVLAVGQPPSDDRANVQTLVERSYAHRKMIRLALNDGRHVEGFVLAQDRDGLEFVERHSTEHTHIMFAQVTSASTTRTTWITVGVIAGGLLTWWLLRNCFFRC